MTSLSSFAKMWLGGASEIFVTSRRKLRKAAQESACPVVSGGSPLCLKAGRDAGLTPWLGADRTHRFPLLLRWGWCGPSVVVKDSSGPWQGGFLSTVPQCLS